MLGLICDFVLNGNIEFLFLFATFSDPRPESFSWYRKRAKISMSTQTSHPLCQEHKLESALCKVRERHE